MAGEIYIADKATLDSVKLDTDKILGSFPISGGTDWSKYQIISEDKQIKTNKDSLTLIKEIDGEGFLNECYLYANNPTWMKIRIVADDVIILETTFSQGGMVRAVGFANIANSFNVTNSVNLELPIMNNPNIQYNRLINPLFFKKLQIWGRTVNSSIYFHFIGGVKA